MAFGSTATSSRAAGDVLLTAADADAGAQRRELGKVAVAAKAEILAGQAPSEIPDAAEGTIVAVEADQAMALQVGERARLAEAREVVTMGVEGDARGADAPREEAALRRPHHAHRDVGVAARQILVPVGGRELNSDAGMLGTESGEDRRQHLAADDVACGHAHDAAVGGRLA